MSSKASDSCKPKQKQYVEQWYNMAGQYPGYGGYNPAAGSNPYGNQPHPQGKNKDSPITQNLLLFK